MERAFGIGELATDGGPVATVTRCFAGSLELDAPALTVLANLIAARGIGAAGLPGFAAIRGVDVTLDGDGAGGRAPYHLQHGAPRTACDREALVKGVTIPSQAFPADFAYKDNSPIKEQLADLIERGVDVHVCPICMKAHGVEASDLLEGAKVTTRPDLFANIGPGTAVFTY